MASSNQIRVIFECDDAITLQVEDGDSRYQRTYLDGALCASGIREAIFGSDINGWPENQEADWIEPTPDQIRCGGYRVMSIEQIRAVEPQDERWQNVLVLRDALALAIPIGGSTGSGSLLWVPPT